MNDFPINKFLRVITFCMLFFVQFIIIFSNYLTRYGHLISVNSINPALPLFICLVPLLILYFKSIIKNKRKIDKFDIILYFLIISGIISIIFSINKNNAIYGSIYRHEGFLSILSYYFLFIDWKIYGKKEDIKSIFNIIIFVALLNSLYGFLQIYTDFDWILRFANDSHMASGFCGHPNFFGTLMTTVLSMILCRILIIKKISIKDILLFIIFLISLINSQSSGPLLAFIVTTLFLIIFCFIKKKLSLKKFLILISLIILIPIITFGTLYLNKKEFNNSRCEICDIKKTIKNGGTGRIDIWKNSLKVVKEHWLVGVGFDNLYLVYPKTDKNVVLVDNAHNVYLHLLVINGIIGLIPYLILCILTFIKGLKSKDESMFILLAGFVAYSVQAFTNLNVIQVAPLYFVIIGLILSIKDNKNLKAKS